MSELLTQPVDDVLSRFQSTSLTRLVAASIETLILSGELAPGAKLNEVALAERLRVSRGPLREAFRMLEESGLIHQEKNRGVFVRVIELADAADIYDVRAGLDATAGRLLAERITTEQLVTLRALTDVMLSVAANDVDQFHTLNLAFHDQIVVMVGNRSLTETYRKLVKQLTLFRKRNLLAPKSIPHFAEEHSAIVDRLAAGDATACAEALFAHARGGRQRMLQGGNQEGRRHER
ncbi:MAG: FCD domain-containing protein [Rhodoferax sp.]|uniref:FCD domain-containing protein n=1 Tax=Rhodoferax sp. TaxID=50421 RepID=UPI0013FFEAD5|nr:FCD domain-containing protein [Rhodoferax sp.]NDP39393.1 FCD domain-containing protein [Rhodoferax sp.]